MEWEAVAEEVVLTKKKEERKTTKKKEKIITRDRRKETLKEEKTSNVLRGKWNERNKKIKIRTKRRKDFKRIWQVINKREQQKVWSRRLDKKKKNRNFLKKKMPGNEKGKRYPIEGNIWRRRIEEE